MAGRRTFSRREWLFGAAGLAVIAAVGGETAALPATKPQRHNALPEAAPRAIAPAPAQPGMPSWVRPSGPGYVRYEDLHHTGDSVSESLARLSSASKSANSDGTAYVTFPEGVFSIRDFRGVPGNKNAPYGIFIPHNALGLIGSGAGVAGRRDAGTIFTIEANSSTVSRLPQDNKTANTCALIYHGTGTRRDAHYRYQAFQIIGTEQPNTYHGLTIHNPAGHVTMSDLIGFGGFADSGAPPGETFLFGLSGGNGPHQLRDVHADGNGTGGGISVENSLNATITDCASKNTVTAPFVLYQAFDTKSFNCVAGPVPINQPNWNHERTAGSVHTNFTQRGVVGNRGVNITHSNDTYVTTIDGVRCSTVNGSLTFIDPVMPPTHSAYAEIQSWSPYSNGDTMTTPPVVRRADGRAIPYLWNHGNQTVIVN